VCFVLWLAKNWEKDRKSLLNTLAWRESCDGLSYELLLILLLKAMVLAGKFFNITVIFSGIIIYG